MDIRLDPRFPLVWRDPQTLQIGAERPIVVLDDVSSQHERIVAAIAAGRGAAGIAALAQHCRCSEGDIAAVLERLRPALLRVADVTSATIAIAGSCALSDEIVTLLSASGHQPTRVDSETVGLGSPPDLGIAVSYQVHDPSVVGAWLRRDVPYLCVLSSDQSTRIGPVVVPGSTACSRCLDLQRTDDDDAWGVIAGQLWGRRPHDPGLLASRQSAVAVVRRVLARLADDPTRLTDETMELIGHDSGTVAYSVSRPHPACGCAALPESDSVDALQPLGSGLYGSTTAADARVRG